MELISIIVPTKDINRERQILKNIGDVGDEIIIVEGKNPSIQRNEGIKKSKGDILYFCDDDSILSPYCFKKAKEIFSKDKDIGVIGGPSLTPETDTVIQKTFGAVLSSYWGTGPSSSRYKAKGKMRQTDEKELILCNMFIKKEVFENCGLFREDLYPNEENEFLNRVEILKYKIIYSPDIYVKRSNRKNFFQFIKQCFNYGRGRAEQMLLAFNFKDIINTIPIFFVIYFISIILLPPIPIKYIPFLIYLFLSFLFSIKAAKENNIFYAAPIIFINFFLLHFSYGVGMLYGFIKFFIKKKEINKKINIKIIKR
ncbi:MAG: glycosyltransferase [Candidatus Goldbacteria bacterium]|nr:glycosyltransferase [Candidatus Goldiibacteriota bacterium]